MKRRIKKGHEKEGREDKRVRRHQEKLRGGVTNGEISRKTSTKKAKEEKEWG